MIRRILCAVTASLMLLSLCGCRSSDESSFVQNTKLDPNEEVKLVVIGPWSEFRGLDVVAESFRKIYPNFHLVYEELQNYPENSLTRLENDPTSVDLFLVGSGIQSEKSEFYKYAYELLSCDSPLRLDDVLDGTVTNYKLRDTRELSLYALPFGAELRGMYVNTTLLDSLGLKVPTNRTELLDAAAKLNEAGYTPFIQNPLFFAQQMLFPYVASIVANSEDNYNRVNSCEAGVSELFRDPMSFLYMITEEKNYYRYKWVETELGLFTDSSNIGLERSFLNLLDQDGDGTFEKKDDVGQVAFMPGIMSLTPGMEQLKTDYDSKIEYEFILSPVTDEGGFAYLSPTHCLSVSKNSTHIDWAMEFMNFVFTKSSNITLNEINGTIPNTSDAPQYVSDKFNLPIENVIDLGQATVDYGFYSLITTSLLNVSKGNNPKYMQDNGDGTYSTYSLEYYMQQLEEAFEKQRQQ